MLTEKLTTAFKLVQIPVTEEMIKEEENVIKLSKTNYNIHQFNSALQGLQNNLDTNNLNNSINRIQEIFQYFNKNQFTDANNENEH